MLFRSSALKQTHGGTAAKAGQAKLHNMEKVTPPSIAYAAIHVRCLCSYRALKNLTTRQTFWYLYHYDDWRLNDGTFLISEFFDLIVDVFECSDNTEWSCETLEWWNQ